ERAPPESLEVALAARARPVAADDVVARGRRGRALIQERDDLVRRAPVVERRDERLHDRRRAVPGPRVAPGLERVRRRHVPAAFLGGLVVEETQKGRERYTLERLSERQVGRRRVDRIPR